jgi:hypothetical protein
LQAAHVVRDRRNNSQILQLKLMRVHRVVITT